VNQARSAFKRKVKKAGATFFYGAMCGFFTAEELDDILFEVSEVAKFLLEVEGTSLDIDEEISIEDRITDVMRNVAESAAKVLKAREAGDDQSGGAGQVSAGGDTVKERGGNRSRITAGRMGNDRPPARDTNRGPHGEAGRDLPGENRERDVGE
jgi:hypothetical protein